MSAYYRRRGEDRVTEVFAAVLQQSPGFLGALVAQAGLPPAAAYEVRTQVTSKDVTIDLEVSGHAADGSLEWLLWSEHKVNDPLTAGQLGREWSALLARAPSGRRQLIAITLTPPTPAAVKVAASVGCVLLRWRDLTSVARLQLTTSASETCRQTAIAHHFLREWIAFANNELEDPVDPLTPERARLLPEAEKALDTVAHLLLQGFRYACAAIGASAPREVSDELHAAPPPGSWLAARELRLYAKYVWDDGFGDADGPCLVVGAWIEGDAAVSARRDRELHTALGERGMAIWDEDDRHGGWIEFGVAVLLTDLAARATLEDQEKMFSEICLRTLTSLAAPL